MDDSLFGLTPDGKWKWCDKDLNREAAASDTPVPLSSMLLIQKARDHVAATNKLNSVATEAWLMCWKSKIHNKKTKS